MKQNLKYLAAAIVLVLTLIVPGRETAAAGKDDLVIGITQFPSTFHPNIDSMLAKSYILAMTRRPLTVFDADWKLICMLCTKLPTIENGLAVPEKTPDGKQGIAVTYTIRPDANWGDGTPVTSKDVVFTWEVGKHPKSGVTGLEFYRRVYKIDVKDDKTFTVHQNKLRFDYNAFGFELVPAHLDRKAFEAGAAEYKNRTTFDTNTTNPGLYSGPYRVTSLKSNSHVVLEPNKSWWGKKPYFKRIVVRVIGNTAALEANLLSGAIDMVAGELGITVDQALGLRETPRQEIQHGLQVGADLRAYRPQSRQSDLEGPPRPRSADPRHRPRRHFEATVRRAPAGGAHQH